MKYFLILFVSFAFINPALAAKPVKGTMPHVQPLQPPPPGISPNYSKNIQYQDPNYIPAAGNSNAGTSTEYNQRPGAKVVPGQSSAAASAQNSGANHYVWWLAALLVALVLVFLVYKRSKSK